MGGHAGATGATGAGKGSTMEGFSAPVQAWFQGAFRAPTSAQIEAWEAIRSGANALVIAPTGSGKTLAAFLWAIDRLAREKGAKVPRPGPAADPVSKPRHDEPSEGVRVLYISPLKALGVDVERNLRAPLVGITEACIAAGDVAPDISVGVRSGDTTSSERRRLASHPPDILITTPESLYLMLTGKTAETLRSVDTVIVDEVHALAGNKRGAHLALSLERLDSLLPQPAQRIGLSATVEPASEVARFLGGTAPVTVVRPPTEKRFDIAVEVPVEDMTNPPVIQAEMTNANSSPDEHRLGSMWPAIENSLYQRIIAASSTIVFTNSRRLAERLTARLNQIHGDDQPVLARAHHGSVSKETRAQVEEDLKSGALRCVVATASLELGIDMGEVDLVVQIDPPPSVSAGLQRMGRSGHQVGGASRAVFYPTHRSKLLETAVIAQRMMGGEIETLKVLSNPLDVLAQQTVAQAVGGTLNVDDWFTAVRRSAPFANLPRSAYVSVLDLVSGRYPSTEFASLRARVDWDRTSNTLTARPGAQRLAVTNGGTIPDRGLYRVVAGSADAGGTRVGELDEEMVYETRIGEVFTLGTTPWRVRQITKDTVEVEPAFGVVAKMPFWRGDSPVRPVEVGIALGELAARFSRSGRDETDVASALADAGFDGFATANTLAYLAEQKQATGYLPGSTTFVVERTHDDVGDWLLILESPLGLAVHAPWALAINARLRDQWGLEGKAVPSNDGIIVRMPDRDELDGPDWLPASVSEVGARSSTDDTSMLTAAGVFLFDPEEIAQTVQREVENSAIFASRFREAASRALILGSSKPGKRSPLWQQRLRASSLLEVAAKHQDFPIILEAMREVLQDVYDVGALTQTMVDITQRVTTIVEVETETPSPFARSLLFGYVGEFMYQGDTPIGERRLAALSVDPKVLRELLGDVPLAELFEADAVTEVEAELQRTKDGWQARGEDGLVDLLRALGPLTVEEVGVRLGPSDRDSRSIDDLIASAIAGRKLFETRMAATSYLAAIEDAGLLTASCGAVAPPGVPAAFMEVPDSPVQQLIARHMASNGPLRALDIAQRFGISPVTVLTALRELEDRGVVDSGLFLPEELADARAVAPGDVQWLARSVLERIRSRSLAILRGSVEPVSTSTFACFLTKWQYCGQRLNGVDGVYTALEQLNGVEMPASTWETLVLPARVADYEPSMLDELVTNGEIRWVGSGAIGARDGWVRFFAAGAQVRHTPAEDSHRTELEQAILDELASRGALFAGALLDGLGGRGLSTAAAELADAIWSLVWEGLVTSDSVAALRARSRGGRGVQKTQRVRPRGRALTRRNLVGLSRARSGSAGQRGGNAGPIEPSLSGRWSLTEEQGLGETTDGAATSWAVEMLERYGIVTRGAVRAEQFPGGFAQAYRLYSDFEMAGTARRGYFVQGLGGAQFAATGAVDQLRATDDDLRLESRHHVAVALAATDPANPYGAALEWPEVLGEGGDPKRNPGAIVVMVDGKPVFYLERGGRTALSDPSAPDLVREVGAKELVRTVRRGDLATFTIEKVNGKPVRQSEWLQDLANAGFAEVPRGVTLRRRIH